MGALARNSFCSWPSANRSARPIKKGRVRTEGHHNSFATLQWIEIALSLFEKKTGHIKKRVPHNKKQPYANIRRITDSAGLRVPPSEELGNAGSPMPWLRVCYGRFPIRFMRPSLLASLIGQSGERNAAHAAKWISNMRLKARSAVPPRAARPACAGGLDRPGSQRKPLSLPISACYTTRARMMLRFLSGVGHAENHHFIPAR